MNKYILEIGASIVGRVGANLLSEFIQYHRGDPAPGEYSNQGIVFHVYPNPPVVPPDSFLYWMDQRNVWWARNHWNQMWYWDGIQWVFYGQ